MSDHDKVLHLVSANCEWEAATHIAALAAALREEGLASCVTAPDHTRLWEFAEAAGVEILPHAIENSINPLRWWNLMGVIKSSGASVVHCHDTGSSGLMARARRFMGHIPVITSRYEMRVAPGSAEYGRGVKTVVCSSRFLAEAYNEHPAAAGKTRVVNDGVNLAAAEREADERDQLRLQYRDTYCPGKEKPLFVVNIAPLERDSCQADILEALAEIVAVLPQTHLFIMGEGEAYEELDRQIRITALERDVTVLEPDRAFFRLLTAADLYVSAMRNDVSGIMIQAAMAAGRAAVATPAGCSAEMVENDKSGVICADAGTQSLKNSMLKLLEDRARREHFGRLAKARAAAMFSVAKQAGDMAEIYRAAMS